MNVYLIETNTQDHIVQASHYSIAVNRALKHYGDVGENKVKLTVKRVAKNTTLKQYLESDAGKWWHND